MEINAEHSAPVDWKALLLDQLEWHWDNHLHPRLAGISDEEFVWEPVPNCWSVRPRDRATSPMAAGAGDVVVDFAWAEPDPVPFTTLAWRMAHVSIVLAQRAANHFGVPDTVDYPTVQWSLDAAEGLEVLDGAYDAWITGLRGLDDDGLARPCGPAEGPFADYPFAALILHITREVIHHGAEMCTIRDLYRSQLQTGEPS
jgi:hypothetical protein